MAFPPIYYYEGLKLKRKFFYKPVEGAKDINILGAEFSADKSGHKVNGRKTFNW